MLLFAAYHLSHVHLRPDRGVDAAVVVVEGLLFLCFCFSRVGVINIFIGA